MGRRARLGIVAVLALYCGQALVGITWGLPSRSADPFLFPDGNVWSGETISRLARAGERFQGSRGSDVDVDPLNRSADQPIRLTATEEDVARIFLRYRLYTYQPDEMIALMALARMKPGQLDLDPRLYQYGGLFLYPLAALIRLCGWTGVIDVRGDVAYYLDHPDEFGKFYVVSRAYAAAWGLIGVLAVCAIARRLAAQSLSSQLAAPCPGSGPARAPEGQKMALMAGLVFAALPVVVCMSHEGKPHLPGAVLMLLAAWCAMPAPGGRRSESGAGRCFWWTCVLCGAAVGMVLSCWPIWVLIPLIALRTPGASLRVRIVQTALGMAAAIAVYLATNPYVLINAFANREVLRSNFGNSLAMYEVSRVGEGLVRVLELTVEGSTLPVALIGSIGLALAAWDRRGVAVPILAAGGLFFLQFALIGAGKPAEYGRFGVFINAVLAVGTAHALGRLCDRRRRLAGVVAALVILSVGPRGYAYLNNFRTDTTPGSSRLRAGRALADVRFGNAPIAVLTEPAPYSCPPLPFATRHVVLVREADRTSISIRARDRVRPAALIAPTEVGRPHPDDVWNWLAAVGRWWEQTPISWANKPLELAVEGRSFYP